MERSSRERLTRGGWLFAVLAVVLLGVSWSLFGQAAQRDEPGAMDQIRDNDRLTRARLGFERAGVELLVDRLLVGTGAAAEDSGRTASIIARLQKAYGDVQELAAGDGTDAALAHEVLDAIESTLVDDPLEDLNGVYDAVDDVRWATGSLPIDAPYDALFEIGFFVALPDHLFVESIVANSDALGLEIAPEIAELHEAVALVVRRDGGWFSGDLESPLTDSEWFDIEKARSVFPHRTDAIEAMFAASPLMAVDAWMNEFDGQTPSPLPVDEVAAEVDELRARVTDVTDTLLVTETAAVIDEAEETKEARDDLWIAGFVALVAGLLTAVVASVLMIAHRRSMKRLSELALRDALTGVSSRHALETHVRGALDDTRFDHHVVVIVDLDRFKMVNDAFGHVVGDMLLCEVARRLQSTADTVRAATPDSATSVVRMGGDEFLVAIHAPEDVRTDLLVFELDAARQRPFTVAVDGGSESLNPEFSYGMAEARGRGHLESLLSAADLAAYADKAGRASGRRESDHRSSPAS